MTRKKKEAPAATALVLAEQAVGLRRVEGVTEEFRATAPGELHPHAQNRKFDQKSPDFKELCASVAANGVIEPLIVLPDGTILAGERRWRAALAGKLPTVPTIIKHGLPEVNALDILFSSNKLRDDEAPIEQGRQVAVLMEAHKGEIAQVAAVLGRTERWVRLRSLLYTNLDKAWKDEAEDKESQASDWGPGHFELLARLPKHVQKEIHEDLKDELCNEYSHRFSIEELERVVNDQTMSLGSAQWDRDEVFEGLPACTGCTKCTAAQPGLWETKGGKDNDRCLDGKCWDAKGKIALARLAQNAREKNPDIKFIAEYSGSEAKDAAVTIGAEVIENAWTLLPAKKDEAGAFQALCVTGRNIGKKSWYKTQGGEAPASTAKPKRSLAERQKDLDRKRWVEVIVRFQKVIQKTPVTAVVAKDDLDRVATVMALAAELGQHPMCGHAKSEFWRKAAKGFDLNGALASLWSSLVHTLCSEIAYGGPSTHYDLDNVADVRAVARLIAYDIDALFTEVSAEKGFTVPKSWAGEIAAQKAKAEKKAAKAGKATETTTKKGKGKKRGKKAKVADAPDEFGESDKTTAADAEAEETQHCRICGCTNDRGCPGGCSWIEDDLCDRCAACADCKTPGTTPECPTVAKRYEARDRYESGDEDSGADADAAFETATAPPCGKTFETKKKGRKAK